MSNTPRTDAKYLLFKPEYGFAQYDSDDGKIRYTQYVESAHEASKEDWSEVAWFDLPAHTFIPATIYVNRLETSLAEKERVLDSATNIISFALDKDYYEKYQKFCAELEMVKSNLTQLQAVARVMYQELFNLHQESECESQCAAILAITTYTNLPDEVKGVE